MLAIPVAPTRRWVARQQQTQMEHDVPAGHLGDPDRAVPELFELRSQVLGLGHGHGVEGARPDADRSEGKLGFRCHGAPPYGTEDPGLQSGRPIPGRGARSRVWRQTTPVSVSTGAMVAAMRVVVDYDLCESNALCMKAAPEVFEVRDDDFLYVLQENPPEELRSKVEEAVQRCPKQAITLED